MSLIARADVPLSISMTTASTLAAAALTPALASLCVGAKAAVSRSALAASTLKVVLLPVLGGLLLRRSFPEACDAAEPALAPAAVVLVALICGSVVAASAAAPLPAPLLLRLCGAVVTHGCSVVNAGIAAGDGSGVRHASNYLGLVARYVTLVVANAWRTRGPLRIISLLCVVGAAWTASAAARTEHGDDCRLAQ